MHSQADPHARPSVGTAKFDVNRCNESPLRGEKPDFWPVSKFNTGSLPLRGILPVTIAAVRHQSAGKFVKRVILSLRPSSLREAWPVLSAAVKSHQRHGLRPTRRQRQRPRTPLIYQASVCYN